MNMKERHEELLRSSWYFEQTKPYHKKGGLIQWPQICYTHSFYI